MARGPLTSSACQEAGRQISEFPRTAAGFRTTGVAAQSWATAPTDRDVPDR
jgi:hypothetical protein